jgi:hypothetical protein
MIAIRSEYREEAVKTKKATLISERGLYFYAGDDLLSHTLSRAVQSALRGLTFGA